jgi:hypothetical protein
MGFDERYHTARFEEVRKGKEEEVQGMALQSLTVLGKQTQDLRRRRDLYTHGSFHGTKAGQTVAYGTYAADPGRQHGRKIMRHSLEHGFEKTRRLYNFPSGVHELSIGDLYVDVTVAFHSREMIYGDFPVQFHSITPVKAP